MNSAPFNGDTPEFSLVLACYNEAPHLQASVDEISRELEQLGVSYELIFVEDLSQDETAQLIQAIVAADASGRMRAIYHERNTGRGRAVADGMRLARGAIVGYIDVDLEIPARHLGAAIAALRQGADVCVGWRRYPPSTGALARLFASKLYAWLVARLLHLPIHDTEAGLKTFRRRPILPILEETDSPGWFWDTEIVARAHARGLRLTEIGCVYQRRSDKRSTVRLLPDTLTYIRELRRFLRRRSLPASPPLPRGAPPAVPLRENPGSPDPPT